MALQPFATSAQVEARTKGAVSSTDPFIEAALKAASRRIRGACGWHIAGVEPATWQVRLCGAPLWLPTLQLVSLTAATPAGALVDVEAREWAASGRLESALRGDVVLTVTHGYAEPPDDIVSLTIDLALGELGPRMPIAREQSLSSSVNWTRTSGLLTPEDRASLAEYRIGWQP